MKCPHCRAECPDDSTFCGKCGARLEEDARPSLTRTLETPLGELGPGALLAGRYRIVGELGRGGMGQVFRAEDTSLSRPVAIKVLPDVFAGDPERLARFEREAKLLAQLNHPHIAIVHGLESHEGRRFLVLELVEGQTLAERLMTGPLPVDEAVGVCAQIAQGLESAHAKAIVHRDLKPANVKITPEGQIKVLDFGLAKACGPESDSAGTSEPSAGTEAMTAPGMVLGTAVYMSPEQARGKPVDRRTDIWAFGCVLFECLTGQRAFQGDSIPEILAAILKGEPGWSRLPSDAPVEVMTLLRRCLRKDPDRRLRDIADARIVLQGEDDLPVASGPMPAPRRARPLVIAAVGAAALILGVLVGPLVFRPREAMTSRAARGPVITSIDVGRGQRLGGRDFMINVPTRTECAFSRKGDFIVYSATPRESETPGISRIYLRRLGRLEAEPVAGTDGAVMPFLSPDDRWIGFWADGALRKVPVEGGLPVTLCEMTWPFGFSWGDDGRIVFSPNRESGLFAITADGGEPVALTEPNREEGEYSHRLPHVLPGSKRALFTITRHGWDSKPRIAVLDLGTGSWRDLLEDGADGRLAGTGHLAFLRRGTLMTVPFDPERLELAGSPVPAVANVSQAMHSTNSRHETGAGQFSVSSSGSLVYAEGGIEKDRQVSLVWLDPDGGVEPVTSSPAPFFAARISPSGRRIAYTLLGMEFEVWIRDLDRGTDTKLTSGGMAEFPQWTPDGTRLVFDWVEAGVPNLFLKPVDGSAPMERLTTSENTQYPSSFTPDGVTLAFVEETEETDRDIYFLDMRDLSIRPFLDSRHLEAYPEFSPDGKWLAYVTDESGRREVYVRPFPEGRGRWQISHQGGSMPVWSPDGRRLFYTYGSELDTHILDVWAVDVETRGGFAAGKPRRLTRLTGLRTGTPVRTWDVSRNGRRLLCPQRLDLAAFGLRSITSLVLVQNWFEEVRRLSPATK